MNLLLIDNNVDHYEFLTPGFDRVIYSPSRSPKVIGWLLGAFSALRATRRTDTIVCWFDFQAILVWWMGALLFMPRRIICMNLLLKDKSTFRNRLVSRLYARALVSPRFTASVTSQAYGQWLNKKLYTHCTFTLLHDVYHPYYEENPLPTQGDYVFCGGRNGRDWTLMFQIAAHMPNVNFCFVLSPEEAAKHEANTLSNVTLLHNLSPTQFQQRLAAARAVCLPLDTQAPAGLIVLFQAAANLRPIIISDTVTTSEYIDSTSGWAVNSQLDSWCAAIHEVLSNPDESRQRTERLRNRLRNECSEASFCQQLHQMMSH